MVDVITCSGPLCDDWVHGCRFELEPKLTRGDGILM